MYLSIKQILGENIIASSEGGVRLDIGCSFHKLPGWIGVDLEHDTEADLLADLHSLPLKENSVDAIHSRHTLEHVREPLQCFRELYRVTKPGGRITIVVPHYSNNAYWSDMTHLRPFGARSFEYYDLDHARSAGFPIYLPDVNLKTLSVKLTYWPERIFAHKTWWKRLILTFLNGIFSTIANISPFLCERIWCYWVGGFYEVTFVLEPVKARQS